MVKAEAKKKEEIRLRREALAAQLAELDAELN
jgi:hypothetical protein